MKNEIKTSICEDCKKEFEEVYSKEHDAHTSFKFCKECMAKNITSEININFDELAILLKKATLQLEEFNNTMNQIKSFKF